MTASRDPDRLIHHFLLEGEEQLQDQVFDAIRADIEQKRQRVYFGPWRTPIMNKFIAFGLGAAAVAAVLLLGSRFLGSATRIGGPGVEPTPTAEASVAEPSSPADGSLPEGSHILSDDGVPITVTISAPGWYGERAGGVLAKNNNGNAPDGAGIIVFAAKADAYVYGDPCQWSTTTPDTPATTVDQLVAALAAQASRDASAPVDITVGGYAGKSITLHVPDDAVFSDCDQTEFRTLIMGPDGARYHQDPGQIDKLWVLDVDGDLVVIDAGYYADTPRNVLDEIEAIVESATLNVN
jgi:hypothetical protein